jgi:hypothetical protein
VGWRNVQIAVLFAVGSSLALACTLLVSTDHLAGSPDAERGGEAAAAANHPDGASQSDVDAAQDAPCSSDDPSLFFYFRFDEGSGTVAHDCSGHGHDGTIVAPGWGPGRKGGALVLDGKMSCVDLGPAASGSPSGAFTFAAWFNAVEFATATSSFYLISKTLGIGDKSGWRVATESSTGVSLRVGTAAGGETAQSKTTLSASTWIHVVTVFDPGQRHEVWVDGTLLDSHSPVPTSIIEEPTANLRVGCRQGARYFLGSLDEVRLYTRALAPTEIAALAR